MRTIAQLRRDALSVLGAASVAGGVLELRGTPGGPVLDQAAADVLLAKAVARERVEIFLTLRAYEQGRRDASGTIVKNSKGIRVRNGGMVAFGRSGKGSPFMRDHRQDDSTARGGTVLESKTVKLTEDGHYEVVQEVELTDPPAVERALRRLMDAVSVGIEPLGEVSCTACGTEIFSKCFHFPFDVVPMKDGTKHEVEWEFSEAGLKETSEVPIAAVPNAEITSIRGALSALSATTLSDDRSQASDVVVTPNQEQNAMKTRLLALLSLAATASDDEILTAADNKLKAADADKAELAIVKTELGAFQADINALKADKLKRDETAFVDGALLTGRIGKGDEEHWRALFAADSKRAVELMAKREPNLVTPVGAPRQSAVDPTPTLAAPAGPRVQVVRTFREPLAGKSLDRLAAQLGGSTAALKFATQFGLVDDGRFPGLVNLSGPTSIANAADHATARVGFHAAFLQELEITTDDPLSLLYTTVQSTRSSEQWNFMGDLPGFEEWVTDRKLMGLKGYKLGVENKKWANGLRVKNDDWKDDNLGLLPSQVNGLATKARKHRWDLMVKLLLNGFDGTAYPDLGSGLSYDGAFFFSDSHLGGNDNKMTVALDAAGLTAAGLQLESMLTLDGSDPLETYGTHLIVGPKLRATAEKLLQQERLANGEDNVHKGKYKLIVSPRIRGTYDDYWFLADLSHGIKPLIFQMREEISTMETGPNGLPAFQADELWFGAQARYNVGYYEPRLIVGSAVA